MQQEESKDWSRNKRILCRYFTSICVLILIIAALGLTTGAGTAAGWGMDIVMLIFVVVCTFCPCAGCVGEKQQNDQYYFFFLLNRESYANFEW